MKEYIFFDIGGTLIRLEEGVINALRYAFEVYGLDLVIPPGETSFIGPPIIDSLVDIWGMNSKTAQIVAQAYKQYLGHRGFCESCLQEGIIFVLDRLKENGKKLYAVSSEWQTLAEKALVYHKVSQYFTGIHGADIYGTCTSKEDIIGQLIADSHLTKTEKKKMVIVGDRWRDMMAAQILGIDFVGVTYGYADAGEFSSVLPERIAASPDELEHVLLSL